VDSTAWSGLPEAVLVSRFDASGHLPFIDERESFLTTMLAFLDQADGKETNRELKFADPIETIKEMTKK